jgi:oxygen-independent coproporphyrinogen-3 oxidase
MPLGLYLHLPFCTVRCSYCPFVISTDLGLQEEYVTALLAELASFAAETDDRRVDTVYFGGGTPSRLSGEHFARVMKDIGARFAVEAEPEISMEANPEDVTPASLAGWMRAGVNRISIGVQSFQDAELVPLGRLHGREGARSAVADAVASGLRTNLDLILGLPGQTADSFGETLQIAIDSGVGHLSLYMLDLEERTPLAVQVERGRVSIPEDDLVADLYQLAIDRLGEAGLAQYEISNFARAGQQCRHNLRYWERRKYRGFGIGAHSFLGERRFANTANIRAYIDAGGQAVDFEERLGEGEQTRETLFLRLRQVGGIHYDDLQRLCGQEGTQWIDRGLRDGWLRREGERVAFTSSGFLLSNEYISQLF